MTATATGNGWGDVLGQDRAVAQLRASVESPVHAYLFVGPIGSGRREAARAFAADLLALGSRATRPFGTVNWRSPSSTPT